jgi:outer membrane murein-binding lipoprotein Lpp
MKHLSLVLFVIILSVVLFPSCDNKNKVDTLAIEQARLDSIRVAESVKREAAMALEQARRDSIRLADEARLASKYHIIVGSFYTPEYARRLAEEYRGKGYNVQILQKRASRFELVSAESFPDFKPAFNRLLEIRQNVMPDAWLYINE